MGYLEVADVYTFVLGSPASVETTFIVEGAMDRLLESSLPRFRKLLRVLDQIQDQQIDDLEFLAVETLGDIKVNLNEQKQLIRNYDYWVAQLANFLGCPRNPFDKRLTSTSGINVSVA